MTSPHALPFTPAFLKTLHQSWQRLRSIFLGSIDRGRQYRTKLDQARHVCHDVNEEFVEAGIGIEPIFTDLQSAA